MSEYDHFEEEEFTTQFSGRVVARIFRQAKPYWTWVVGFMVMIALCSVLDALFTFLSKRIIDEGIVGRDAVRLLRLIELYGGLAVLQAGAVFGFVYWAGVLGERIHYDIRRKLFEHLQELSFSYFDRTPVGWIMARVTSDAGRMADLITWGLVDVTWAALNIVTSLGFMLAINSRSGSARAS
jgi:ATP-binding cassette subfamily B protein